MAICLETLEDLLPVVEDRSSGMKAEVGGGDDSRVLPATALGVVRKGHVVRVVPAEPRIGERGGPLLVGDGVGGSLQVKNRHGETLSDAPLPTGRVRHPSYSSAPACDEEDTFNTTD